MGKFYIYLSRIPYYCRLIYSRILLKFIKFKKFKKNNNLIYNKFLIDNKLKDLINNGYCTLKLSDILNKKDEIEILEFIKNIQKKEIKTYEKNFLNNFIGGDFLKNKKFNFDLKIPLYKLAINQSLINIVKKYFNYSCKLIDIQLAETKVINEKDGRVYSQRWHQDPSLIGVIKIFIYFSNVTLDSGPFEYLKHTHLSYKNKKAPQSTRKMGGSFYPKTHLIESYINKNMDSKMVLEGKIGTIIIADTSGFHRGGFSRKKSRLMSTFVYYPKIDPIKTRIKAHINDRNFISNIQKEFIS